MNPKTNRQMNGVLSRESTRIDPPPTLQPLSELQAWLGRPAELPSSVDFSKPLPWHEIGNSPALVQLRDQLCSYIQAGLPLLIRGEIGTGALQIAESLHTQRNEPSMSFRIDGGADRPPLTIMGNGPDVDHQWERLLASVRSQSHVTCLLCNLQVFGIEQQIHLLRVVDQICSDRLPCQFVTVMESCDPAETVPRDVLPELYFALSVLELQVPPLRDRLEDIPWLVDILSQHAPVLHAAERRSSPVVFTDEAKEILKQHDWPGNLWELRNVVWRVSALANSTRISLVDLQDHWHPKRTIDQAQVTVFNPSVPGLSLDQVERQMILSAIDRHQGNKHAAARELGVTSRTLQNKMRQYRQLGYVA